MHRAQVSSLLALQQRLSGLSVGLTLLFLATDGQIKSRFHLVMGISEGNDYFGIVLYITFIRRFLIPFVQAASSSRFCLRWLRLSGP